MDKKYRIYQHDGKPCKTCGKLYHYPTPYLLKAMKKAKKDRKEGKASPVFNTTKDAIKWFDEEMAKEGKK